MSALSRDKSLADYSKNPTGTDDIMTVYQIDSLTSPFGDLASNLSDSELRETAYEILVGACRSSGVKPLTYVQHSDKNSASITTVAAPSLQRSITSTAASKVKKALGMKSGRRKGGELGSQGGRGKKTVTVGEIVRVQMLVPDQTDSRIRRALLRIAAGQLGRRMESIVLPLELMQQLKSSDFSNQQEYAAWQRRNLKLLEAGLLMHPHIPLDKTDTAPQRLRMIVRGAIEKPLETGKNTESMQALRGAVMSLACRSSDGSVTDTCHWADGFPLNLRIYQMLLEACFDVNEEMTVIEEIDEVLELIKKTWALLGMNQMLHNVCFLWILFYRYVTTGQVETDLLFAANNLLLEVQKDVKETKDPDYSKLLSSILSSVMGWCEKKLLSYHDTFHSDNTDSMENIVSLGVTAAQILVEDISLEYRKKRKEVDVARDRVDTYIRSSIRHAFVKLRKKAHSNKRSSNSQLPFLSILAEDSEHLAFNEKAMFSPILKRWHQLSAGVAVATLHSCYGNELKQFVSGISELTPDCIQILKAADKLEKDLVQIAVMDSVDSEDGGMSIIREMPPYEAEAVIASLVKSWIKTRVDRLKEWVDRNLQQEAWNPRANKEQFAPSAVEVLRMVDETLEAFFLLPIPMHPVLLPDLMSGVDKCLQHYILKTKSGCGSRSTFVPSMPALTRCSTRTKFNSVFKKKEKLQQTAQRRKSQVGSTNTNNSFGIPQLCCRINTMQYIRTEIESLGKRAIAYLKKSESTCTESSSTSMGKGLELSSGSCVEGIQQLCEATAYKIIFHELSNVLWDGLYIGIPSSSRIEHLLQELEQYLEIISSTVHDRVRTRVITEVMKASCDGFLLVLLAGGPSRGFTCQDAEMIAEDFKFLAELFWSNGDGLPADLIEKLSTTVKAVLPLFHADTESVIERFKCVVLESYGSSAKSRLPLPPTSGKWNPNEANTLLRVLCYRNDDMAAKFLKKNYDLPTKL